MVLYPYLPGGDGPQHIATSYAHLALEAGVDDGRYARLVEAGMPPTNQGFLRVFSFWLTFVPWQDAVTWSLATTTAAWALGVALLIRVVSPARWPMAFVMGPLGFSWPLYMGFFSFHLALSLALIVTAVWGMSVERGRPWLGAFVVCVGMWGVVRAHVFVAALALPLLAVMVLVAAPGAQRRAAAVLALAVVPALALGASIHGTDGVIEGGAPEWESLALGLRLRPLYLMGDPWWRQLPVALVALWALFSRPTRPLERGLLLIGAALVVLTLAAPGNLMGWRHFAVRFGALGVAIVVVHAPLERLSGRVRVLAVVGAVLFGLSSLAWLGRTQQELHRCVARIAEAGRLSHDTDALRAIVPLDPYCGAATGSDGPFPYIPWAANAGMYLTISQGGAAATWFAYRQNLHSLRWRGSAPYVPITQTDLMTARARALDGRTEERAQVLERLAAGAAFADEVVLTIDHPGDEASFLARGFEELGHQGTTYLLRFVGCELTVEAPCAAGTSCVVEAGFSSSREALVRHVVEPGTVTLSRAPCGARWMRVQADGRDLCLAVEGRHPVPDGPGPHRCTALQP